MSRCDDDLMDLGDSDNDTQNSLYDLFDTSVVQDFSVFDYACESVQAESDLIVPKRDSNVSLDVVYDRDGPPLPLDPACHTMLTSAFISVFEILDKPEDAFTDYTASQIFERIKLGSNYSVVKIERITNSKLQELHNAFKIAYNITNTRTVYHGTSPASSNSIIKTGFRGAASVRSKFGKGIYSTANIWEALAYAEPSADYHQVFLAATLLQGPTRYGENELVDFGTNESGDLFLTCTNPENTIFCASHGIQLLSEYRITVKYEIDTATTQQHKNRIRMYHPIIWKVANTTTALPVVPVHGSVLPTAKRTHRGISIGDRVKIVKPFKYLEIHGGHIGTVRGIAMDGQVKFFVDVADPSVRSCMEAWFRCNPWHNTNINDLFDFKTAWVICKFCQLEIV